MSTEKAIDLPRRRKLIQQMAKLEAGMKELRKEFATPEQLKMLALAEVQAMEKHFQPMAANLRISMPWLLEVMTLWGVYARLDGHDPDPSDALAMVTKNTDFLKDAFKAAVTARIAKFEDDCIQ